MSEATLPVRDRGLVRVVIADDHAGIRAAIQRVLSSSFDVVAAVADGSLAVDAVERFHPDVVVLDISTPVLDGFGAARELVRRGARAKIVFLTVHAGDEYVAAAVEAGVQGYVVKSRMATDLADAIRHVLQGRLRLPASSSLPGIADERARHAVQIYANDDARLDDLTRLAASTLRRGDAVVAVGRPAMLDGVASRLTDARFDLTTLGERGRYQAIDAEHYLSRSMRGNDPDEASLVEFVRGIEHRRVTSVDRESNGVVVFGEIAPLLLRDGNIRGALAVERIWHRHAIGFHTLCSYSRGDLDSDGRREVFAQVCAVHQAVSA